MKQHLANIIDRAKGAHVLCVGDVMLDRYVYGSVARISPESPVPVLAKERVSEMVGGAGNVARNMAAMGLDVTLIGLIGSDEDGERLSALANNHDRINAKLIQTSAYQTVVKSRFVAQNQQLLRVDTEGDPATIPEISDELINRAKTAIEDKSVRAIIVSDYAKGVVTRELVDVCVRLGSDSSIPVLVDPKDRDLRKYKGVTLIKPNASELSAAAGLPCSSDQDIDVALRKMSAELPETMLIVTRAEKGMSWLEGNEIRHKRGEAREVYDVSGAGDTSMAAIALGSIAGSTIEEAVTLAVTASGIAVGKSGTATVDADELKLALISHRHALKAPVLDLDLLMAQVSTWRSAGHTIGFTNGCFDILHPGHLKLLEEAAERCDKLVVAINSDQSVKRLKGESRPVNTEYSRALVLAGIAAVDAVTIFEEDTPAALIQALMPDLLVKGGDYSIDTIVGADTVLKAGGEVHIVETAAGHSTTAILKRSLS